MRIAVAGYYYAPRTPIEDNDQHPWRHLLRVEWEQHFEPIRYPNPYCAQATVLDLAGAELRKIRMLLAHHRTPISSRGPSSASPSEEDTADEQIQCRELKDWAYTRYTSTAIKTVHRRHVKLCNQFTRWLNSKGNTNHRVERRSIDLAFRQGGLSYLVEFKIAYRGDPKPAIREALGQILEYNHYPGRKPHDHWILVLDCQPTADNLAFLQRLRRLGLRWRLGGLPVRDLNSLKTALSHDRARGLPRDDRDGDEQVAYAAAAWLQRTDRNSSLSGFLNPGLTAEEHTIANIEGWILGVV